MKGHTIAIMVMDISTDYSIEMIGGISNYLKDKDVNMIFTQVKMPNISYGAFEHQYWAGKSLLEAENIDAVIVISSFFISMASPEDVISYLRPISHKPIVSIGLDLPFTNSCSLKTDSKGTYRKVFKHLIEKHSCKKIAFMSANKTKSPEAQERYESYLAMLEEFNLPFDRELVIDGDFTTASVEPAFAHIQTKDDVKFDAIICANDLMALGVLSELNKRGVKVPSDVKVIGFDNTLQSGNVEPTLSTISQDLFSQGEKAAELAYRAISGEKVETENLIPLSPIFRQSCGCVEITDNNTNYVNDSGEKIPNSNLSHNKTAEEYIRYSNEKRNIYFLLDILQMSESLSDLFARFEKIMYSIDMRRVAICLFDEPIYHKKGEEFVLPDRAELAIAIDREFKKEIIMPRIKFNPHDYILPEDIFTDDFAPYLMEALFYGDKQYGYTVYKQGERNYSLSTIYMKIISTTIVRAYELTMQQIENQNLSTKNDELIQDNITLNIKSQTDELTKILNRRGFLASGQKIIETIISQKGNGLVIFCDMDGLKKINDQFGHEMGDKAIIAEADALQNSFRPSDLVGRLSGDEFAVIASGCSQNDFPKIYERILKNCSEISRKNNFEFNLSVSAGAVEISDKVVNLQTLLSEADSEQYKEKRRKHAAR